MITNSEIISYDIRRSENINLKNTTTIIFYNRLYIIHIHKSTATIGVCLDYNTIWTAFKYRSQLIKNLKNLNKLNRILTWQYILTKISNPPVSKNFKGITTNFISFIFIHI